MTMTPLQRLAHYLRQLHLLQIADFFWFLRLNWLARKANRRFREAHPEALVPSPMVLYDIQGDCHLDSFYQSGVEHAREISRVLSGYRPGAQLEILEWGCGPARVLSHLKAADGATWRLNGSDYNPRTIAWCRENVPGIRFLLNGLEPPIAEGDAAFDVIYCISVFTHLSEENHYAWLAEIERLLKPGGLFFGTFHGAAYRDQMTDAEKALFDAGQLVFRGRIKEGKKNYTAYHCDDVVRRLLSSHFEQVQKLEDVPGFTQTIWTAVKATGIDAQAQAAPR